MKAMIDLTPKPLDAKLSPPGRGRRLARRLKLSGLLIACLLPLLGGCSKPPLLVNQYILEYPPPVVPRGARIPETLKVELFAVAQTFNTGAMVYQPSPYQNENYNYSRWRVNPGFMVTDYLLRDLRDAHIFQAVFGPGALGRFRFVLQGGVEKFLEVDNPGVWQASLAVTVTLLDVNQAEVPQRVVFQKHYQAQEPMFVKTPQGLAQAMSRAMEQVSGQIIHDIYQAAQKRLAAPPCPK
jgi:ABC-type uncharacterized transport system auxiliary subunit